MRELAAIAAAVRRERARTLIGASELLEDGSLGVL